MDVREKLVELLKTNACPSPFMCDPACRYYGFGDCFPDRFADHLISNGVTVQEWIPQTELSWMGEEIAKLCIRYMEDYADFHGYASSKKVKAHIVRLLELEKGGRIAILPQPPKGE